MSEQNLYQFENHRPLVAKDVFIAPGARIIGRVRIGKDASIWYNTVVRGDADEVKIGAFTNIQDSCVLHEDPGYPLTVGERVTVGHSVILHGCTVGDGALIGMGAIVLNGAVIGDGAVVAAGSVVTPGQEIPPGCLAMGSPARVVRALSEKEREEFQGAAERYHQRAREHLKSLNSQ